MSTPSVYLNVVRLHQFGVVRTFGLTTVTSTEAEEAAEAAAEEEELLLG